MTEQGTAGTGQPEQGNFAYVLRAPSLVWTLPLVATQAYFAGATIVDSIVKDLSSPSGNATSLADATFVIWTGDSAGGIGAVASVDRVASFLPGAKVRASSSTLLKRTQNKFS